tara:strand:- start:2956 stop:3231 length:276 start_codon:yes stop_codon:yes gene_type:complete
MLYEFTVSCLECEGEGKIYRGEGDEWVTYYDCDHCNGEGVEYSQAYYDSVSDLKEDFPDAENIEKHTLTEYEKYWLKHNPEVLEYDNIKRY